MEIKHQSIILDVNKANILPNILAHQGDQKTRFIDVTLTMSGEELILNDSYRAVLKASNNGEVKAINDCQIDLERNVIIVELTNVMLDTAGFLNCEITVVDEDKYITSQSFLIEVALSTVADEEEIQSSTEYGTLVKLMEEVSKIEQDAHIVKEMISHLAEIQDIDTLVNSKADKETVEQELAKKANTTDVDNLKSYVANLEENKANNSDLEKKENISNKFNEIIFPSTNYYPTHKAVWDFVDNSLSPIQQQITDNKSLINTNSESIDSINSLCNAQKVEYLSLLPRVTTNINSNFGLTDSSNYEIDSLSLYGNSTQSAVPTPTEPVDIVSVENPSITISNNDNNQIVTTQCTLRGVSDICDTLTVNSDGTGFITQNLLYETIKSGKSSSGHTWHYSTTSGRFYRDDNRFHTNYGTPKLMCSHFEAKDNEKTTTLDNTIGFTAGNGKGIAIRMTELNGDVSAFESWLDENEVYILVPLSEPIISEHSKDEVDKILSLHTYYPTTTITSNANTQITYVADIKNYIDNKIS